LTRIVNGLLCLLVFVQFAGGHVVAAEDGNTSLWQRSIERNDLAKLRQLLPTGIDVHLTDRRGNTALMKAARFGDLSLVDALLVSGADVNQVNHNGGTALMHAAFSGDSGVFRMLINKGAELDVPANNGWTALMFASAKGHDLLVREMLDLNANINTVDIYGWTALMRATGSGRGEVVQLLLTSLVIEIDRQNSDGQTALHIAVESKNPVITGKLLTKGASSKPRDGNGFTVLDYARKLQLPLIEKMIAAAS